MRGNRKRTLQGTRHDPNEAAKNIRRRPDLNFRSMTQSGPPCRQFAGSSSNELRLVGQEVKFHLGHPELGPKIRTLPFPESTNSRRIL
ncbi:hypothetical protein N7466_000834 [Penicillium verhagenii]|uniref:uncharacterized protein n=1 Tax=Penicillium verhagenii TaxID=1562060 RepID=UPI0025454BCC|nr:uncharacterized protein N7466_000834 [Penicillium verhagenii]KAJ5947819.1 hypothetical protein N7466_000834 [Penicillium verhagenii]